MRAGDLNFVKSLRMKKIEKCFIAASALRLGSSRPSSTWSSAELHRANGIRRNSASSGGGAKEIAAVGGLLLSALVAGGGVVHTAHQEDSKAEDGTAAWPEPLANLKGWALLSNSTRRRLFYKYERRIRDLSQTDKVFHYFASNIAADGTRVMSLGDLVRAIVAVYPPEESEEARTGGLAGEPGGPRNKRQRTLEATSTKDSKFLKAFDIDNDGISYPEFLLLSTFLTIPAEDVTVVFKMFDLNGDGAVHVKEFEEITGALQKRLRKVSSVQRTGANITPFDSSRGLRNHFFGEGGEKSLQLETFAHFIAGLHKEILRLEFEHYDVDGDETIPGLDFARSIASNADLGDVDKYLDRAAALPDEIKTMKVTYDQFQHFAVLHQQVHQLAVALEFYHNIGGRLERADFKRATRIVTGSALPDTLVEVVFRMFDTRDGSLMQHELIEVLQKRASGWSADDTRTIPRKQNLLSCLLSCAFD